MTQEAQQNQLGDTQSNAGNAGEQQADFNQMFNPQNTDPNLGMDEIGSNIPQDVPQEGQKQGMSAQEPQQQPQKQAQQPQKSDKPEQEGDTPTRYEYWQSEADKAKNELKQAQQDLDRYKRYEPVIDAVQEHPEILDTIEQSISQEQTPQIEKPEAPERPPGYNENDAYQDPDSESYKYRIKMDDYRQDVIEYQNKKLELFEQKEQQRQQQLRQQQQKRQQIQQAKQRLKNEYDLPDNMAEQLIREASNNDLVNNENLIKLFFINHPEYRTPEMEQRLAAKGVFNQTEMNFNTQPTQQGNQRPQQGNRQPNPQSQNANNQNFINNLKQNNSTPPSVTTASGANNIGQEDPNESFIEGLGKVTGNVEF